MNCFCVCVCVCVFGRCLAGVIMYCFVVFPCVVLVVVCLFCFCCAASVVLCFLCYVVNVVWCLVCD
jgi:hypothetical protein